MKTFNVNPIKYTNSINATDTNYFIIFLLSNFQIIIGKHKYDISSGLILELIRVCHINHRTPLVRWLLHKYKCL